MQAEIRLFSEGQTAAEQANALSVLIKLKQLHQAAKDERFAHGVAALSAAAKDAKHPNERVCGDGDAPPNRWIGESVALPNR